MAVIIVEWVLFAALVVTAGVLVKFVVEHYTGAGKRRKQLRNRQEIDRAAELVCPTHGVQAENALVRLDSGEVMCPVCYREAIDMRLEP